MQTLSAFSGINETDRRWDAPVTLAGYHEWGKIDDKWTNGLLYGNAKDGNKEEFTRFEIERYNHNGGPVILGFRRENGKYMWYVFVKQLNGKYAPAEGVLNRHEDEFARGGIKNTVDVRYEGQGKFIVREYENGYKMYFNAAGELVSQGYNVSLLNMSVDGKQLIFGGKDADNNNVSIIDEDGKYIALGNHIEMYPDALVIEQANKSPGKKVFYLTNWHGKQVELEGCKYFDSIKAYNNEGSYYLLKNERNGYAVVGKGFMRVGGWYQTEDEAHQAWKTLHGNR